MGILRLLLILIFIYAVYNFVFKVIVPFAARSFVNKAQRDMQERMRQMEDQQRKPEGEINITKKKKGDDGEYVDYEEVE
jgi:hypothetical protein